MSANAAFLWQCHPDAEKWILEKVEHSLNSNATSRQLKENLLSQTSTRLFDWLDYIVIDFSEEEQNKITDLGFTQQEITSEYLVYHHQGAQFPRIVFNQNNSALKGMAVNVDSIADFLLARGGENVEIEGVNFGCFRRCPIYIYGREALWAVERKGTQTLVPTNESPETILTYHEALEKWQTRFRGNEDETQAIHETLELAKNLVSQIGTHRAAWTVLEGERRYWQLRNSAGQIQKSRQDRLGMGWSNHDHHTFRSSRKNFAKLVHLFEILGFVCRERYYAGEEAGWGAQIMENLTCRLVLFLDVDLDPHEIQGDIAHEPLPELKQLGTIGLWCGLHGDSILKAGMHHLEAQFMFDDLTQDLSRAGVKMMKPFSSFSFLKQAFTVGENWPVDPLRVETLLKEQKISEEQANKFLLRGAIGSHLENLQRREGYKGFNQKNVSQIIKETDPRGKNFDFDKSL
ncbi:MAG: hypothetical protein H0V82_00545 [Candidatus Protochlamydia sp.]|nr:hypothetical protein [Candidatus Protochlamydia sp.]